MPWIQLHIDSARDDVESLEDSLLSIGALSVTLSDSKDTPIFEPGLGETPLWAETKITALFDASANTKALQSQLLDLCKLDEAQLKWEILEDQNWERAWMDNYEPIQCSDSFWICPSWKPVPDKSATNLILDPGLAFGTGTHPTTFLCLQWLSKFDCKNKNVVDFGCGSGILGIAALLLGANHAIGVDIDPQALQATHENVARNALKKESFNVYLPQQAPDTKVELVLANILAGPLVDLRDQLVNYLLPGAKICLSGILAEQEKVVTKAYSDRIGIDSVFEKDGWICIIGSNPE